MREKLLGLKEWIKKNAFGLSIVTLYFTGIHLISKSDNIVNTLIMGVIIYLLVMAMSKTTNFVMSIYNKYVNIREPLGLWIYNAVYSTVFTLLFNLLHLATKTQLNIVNTLGMWLMLFALYMISDLIRIKREKNNPIK